jgi:hypothetical protein
MFSTPSVLLCQGGKKVMGLIRKIFTRASVFLLVFVSMITPAFAQRWVQADPDDIPTNFVLNDVWVNATMPDDSDEVSLAIFGVGNTGTILLSDGGNWVNQASGTSWSLNGVWGTSANNVFAVGDAGTVLHFNGEIWQERESNTPWNLNDVWGSSPGSVYAVGDQGTVLHFNGEIWQKQESNTRRSLNGVWGSSSGSVYAVGDNGTIIHFNGESWVGQTSGTIRDLSGVWGSSPQNVYAVGKDGTVLRYDGHTWTSAISDPSLAASLKNTTLNAVWGTSPCNVYAAGQSAGLLNPGTILHFDGSSWTIQDNLVVATNLLTPVIPPPLKGIHGGSIRDIYAVGGTGFVMSYDPDEAGLFPVLCSVFPASGTQGAAVDTVVSATFSASMSLASITENSFTLSGPSGEVEGSVSYSDNNTAVFRPDADLAYETTYTVRLSDTIADVLGFPLETGSSWSFTTRGEPAESHGSCFISVAR